MARAPPSSKGLLGKSFHIKLVKTQELRLERAKIGIPRLDKTPNQTNPQTLPPTAQIRPENVEVLGTQGPEHPNWI